MDQVGIRSGEPVTQLVGSERPAAKVDRRGTVTDNQTGG